MDESLRVLVVDDEVEFLELMAKRLGRRGFAVETAASCDQALAALARSTPEVVVLDVMLPDRDGIACLREIKKNWPEVAVILLTGHASLQAGMQGIGYGASDYCLKPIELGDLVEKIRIAHAEAQGLRIR